MKVYTKTGDDGTTSLIGGERVPKNDPRVESYGTVDELSAHLALLCDMMRCDGRFESIVEWFDRVQKDLFVVEAMLAVGKGGRSADLPESAVSRLEQQIDVLGEGLPPVSGFVIPGGHPIVSMSHVCRAVCRGAERTIVGIQREYGVPTVAARYLNRLSDWLYVLGRRAVEILSIKENYWEP